MQTTLHPRFATTAAGSTMERILRNCVHCGFCNATCPTYLELGDERDGPRGRIYLIKHLLETGGASEKSQRHLDRCLTCRACETTCPSGVEYGKLVDFGRAELETQVVRPLRQRLQRKLLRAVVPYRTRFRLALKTAQAVRFLLPETLRKAIPRAPRERPAKAEPYKRTILLLDGCAQAAATPNTNHSATRVLGRLGISAQRVARAGCCGALSYHLSQHDEARKQIRHNIDALLPGLEHGAEKVVSAASACTLMLKDYGEIMADDPDYSAAAKRISESVADLCELLADEDDLSPLASPAPLKAALHCPCTLTHGLGKSDKLRAVLNRAGISLSQTLDDHLCCGSAGSYSILQPELSKRLLNKKLEALMAGRPQQIVTANVGCQLHLASGAEVPVSHWIELLDR